MTRESPKKENTPRDALFRTRAISETENPKTSLGKDKTVRRLPPGGKAAAEDRTETSGFTEENDAAGRREGLLVSENDVVGNYRLRRLLGSDSSGRIFTGEDTRLGRRVFLRIYSREITCDAEDLLRRQIKTASTISHNNMGRIYAFEIARFGCFLASEYVAGTRLSQLIARRSLNLENCLEIIRQIAEVIEEAHRRQIVFEDLRAGEIIIDKNSQAKIYHFACRKITDFDSRDRLKTVEFVQSSRNAVENPDLTVASSDRGVSEELAKSKDVRNLKRLLGEMLAGTTALNGGDQTTSPTKSPSESRRFNDVDLHSAFFIRLQKFAAAGADADISEFICEVKSLKREFYDCFYRNERRKS